MTELRESSADEPGWVRRRAGRGFSYVDAEGRRATPAERERFTALAIPPAWRDVWICADPGGHLQAVGTDDAGRRQYLYHPQWRIEQDAVKFARAAELGRVLGRARSKVRRHLALDDVPLELACATAFRMLDLGCFRVGNDSYADAYGSFGLTTLERSHVRLRGEVLHFDFVGKLGVEHHVEIDDPEVVESIARMRRRRGEGDHLLSHRDSSGTWWPVRSEHVNDYVRTVTGLDATAKDFRTWHATVAAAAALATDGTHKAAWEAAADLLGNTPTQARTSYVDPRVVAAHEAGATVPRNVVGRAHEGVRSRELELAVLRLLDELGPDPESRSESGN